MRIRLPLFFKLLFLLCYAEISLDASPVSPTGENPVPASSPGANQVFDISYSVEPFYEINIIRLIIVLEFKGDKTGETKILLPKGPNINSIRFLKTLTPNTYMTDTDRPDQKIIKYPPGSILRIYYQVEEIRDGDPEQSNYLLPILKRHYFHFSGESFFIVPNWDGDPEYNFRIMWNHLPANWKLANNFGVNSNYQEFKTTIRKFNDASFTGGVFSIIPRYIGSDVIYIAAQGSWKFSEEQFCDLVRDIMIEERNFWNDHSTNFFLVDLIQLAGRGDQVGEVSWNSYSVFLSGDRIIDLQLKRLLAHDLFHTWIGEKVTFAEPEQLVYWFKEGFTDYYTNLILLRAKLISLEEYADQYNIILESYYTSPMRYEKNDRLINEFHSDMDLTRLPYQRGQIFAHNLNYMILKNSSRAKSLDDFMRDLMSRCTNENLVISNGSLSALIRFYAGDEILSDMMRTLNSGAVLKAIPEALGPCFKMEIASRKKMIIFGEQFDIPSYKLNGDKDCLGWFHAD